MSFDFLFAEKQRERERVLLLPTIRHISGRAVPFVEEFLSDFWGKES